MIGCSRAIGRGLLFSSATADNPGNPTLLSHPCAFFGKHQNISSGLHVGALISRMRETTDKAGKVVEDLSTPPDGTLSIGIVGTRLTLRIAVPASRLLAYLETATASWASPT